MTKSIMTIINCCIYLSVSMWCQNVLALGNGDTLDFSAGSYFGVEIAPGSIDKTPLVSHNGIIIGQEQPASGSHSGNPDGNESPSIDEPWSFFGNTGMFQTVTGSGGVTITSNDGNGHFELDFSGFGATWNGIPNIDLGGAPTFPEDAGIATLTCSSPACGVGSGYVLDYSAHVPDGDPSGFGGVLFVVHLEGNVGIMPDILSLDIDLPGSNTQECSVAGGSIVDMSVTAKVPNGDAIESITWKLDGNQIGTGDSVSSFVSLGQHSVTAVLLTKNGLTTGDSVNLGIVDTTSPNAIAEFVSVATGEVVDVVDTARKVKMHVGATDICDPAPEVTYSRLERNNSVPVSDGDTFVALPKGNTNIYKFEESLRLSVTAHDASGNAGSTSSILTIAE